MFYVQAFLDLYKQLDVPGCVAGRNFYPNNTSLDNVFNSNFATSYTAWKQLNIFVCI